MSCINRLEEDLDTRHFISDAIAVIFSAFDQRLGDLELEKLEAPLATELAMAKLHKLIDLATMAYDGAGNPDEIFERMSPDGEPYPDKIDSWARGFVTTRKVVIEEINFNKGSLTARSGAPSVSSYRSSATGKTRSSSASRTVRSLGSRASDRDGKAQDTTGQIIELDGPDNEFGDFNATGSMFEMLPRAKRKKEKGNFSDINENDDDVKGEFELLQEQFAKTAKDLRGKKFILDRYGQPIILGNFDPKRLPALTTAPHLQVKEGPTGRRGDVSSRSQQSAGGYYHPKVSPRTQKIEEEQAAISLMRQQHGHLPPGATKDQKRQFIRVAGSRGVDEASFMPTVSLATTLSGVDHIPRVNPGVIVRSKTSSKAGEAVVEDAKHISRKTLLAKTSPQQQLGGLSQASVMSPVGSSSMFSPGNRSQQGLTVGFQESSFVAGPNGQDLPDVQVSIDSLPDFNRLEGSRKIVRVDETRDWTDAELGIGPYDPAMSQTSSKAGGQSPDSRMSQSKLPQKPSGRQEHNIRLLRGSPDKGKPKDRDQPKSIHPVAQRRHLPAPPLGQTMGHGLTIDKLYDKNSIQGGDSATQHSNWTEQWRN
jgi:hypothetical protein